MIRIKNPETKFVENNGALLRDTNHKKEVTGKKSIEGEDSSGNKIGLSLEMSAEGIKKGSKVDYSSGDSLVLSSQAELIKESEDKELFKPESLDSKSKTVGSDSDYNFLDKFKNKSIKYVYSPEYLKEKSLKMDEIRDQIQAVELTEEDKSPSAIIEYGRNCVKQDYGLIRDEYYKEGIEFLKKNMLNQCKEILVKNNMITESEAKDCNLLEKITDEMRVCLIKKGYYIEDKEIYQIPEANDDNLLQNKRIKELISIGKAESSKYLENTGKTVLEGLVDEFDSIYKKNKSPKDIESIIKLIDYQVHISLPAGGFWFSQMLLHTCWKIESFVSTENTAHFMPSLSNFETGGITDDNGGLSKKELGYKDGKVPGTLPLDLAVATGVGVCHQNALLAKYLLDELKDRYPDIEYLGSYVTSNDAPLSDISEDTLGHFNLMVITEDIKSDSVDKTEVFSYNVLDHEVSLLKINNNENLHLKKIDLEKQQRALEQKKESLERKKKDLDIQRKFLDLKKEDLFMKQEDSDQREEELEQQKRNLDIQKEKLDLEEKELEKQKDKLGQKEYLRHFRSSQNSRERVNLPKMDSRAKVRLKEKNLVFANVKYLSELQANYFNNYFNKK